jgi:hypothetical protein
VRIEITLVNSHFGSKVFRPDDEEYYMGGTERHRRFSQIETPSLIER